MSESLKLTQLRKQEALKRLQALQKSHDRYAEFYDFAPVGYLTLNRAGIIQALNITAAKLLGMERSQLLHRSFLLQLQQDQDKAFLHHLEQVFGRNDRIVGEFLLQQQGQRPMVVRIESTHSRIDDCCRSALIDISETRRAEQQQTDVSVQLKSILDTVVDGIITIDTHGIVQLFNPAAERIFGYSAQEVIGRNVNILMPSPDRERHGHYIRQYLKTRRATVIGIGREVSGRRKDGSIFPLELAVTETVDDRLLFTGVLRDISERKRLQEDLLRQRAKLAHMGRISLAGEMAAVLAHEINQPLTAIVSYGQLCRRLLQSGNVSPEHLAATCEKIVVQGKRAGEVIRQLRRLIGKAESKYECISLADLIAGVMQLLDLNAKNQAVSIVLELEENLPPLWVDTLQIQQVLLNLIHNAIDAMDANKPDQRQVTIQAVLLACDRVEVRVRDQGAGSPVESLGQLFEPFFSTKSNGMGFGLAVCHSIIQAHGSKIWATRNPDRGITFHFTLPIAGLEKETIRQMIQRE